jgi:hypothetical protein
VNVAGYAIIALILALGAVTLLLKSERSEKQLFSERAALLQTEVDRLKLADQERDLLASKISNLDKQHTAAMRAANEESESLRRAIRDGAVRLSVRTSCPRLPETTSTASVDHGEARAELNRADAEDIVAITSDGDDAIRQLSACQSYVEAVTRSPSPALQNHSSDAITELDALLGARRG